VNKIELLPLRTIPQVKPGDDLGGIISQAAQREIGSLQNKDIAIITMKIVSKAEGCLIHLDKVSPSEKAKRIARKTGKPVQLIQAILDHSEKIIGVIPFYKLIKEGIVDPQSFSHKPEEALELIRHDPTFLITLDKRGAFYSDAGVDTSNHPKGVASYPPSNPDHSAKNIRQSIRNHTDKNIAVIIADTEIFFGGTIDMPRGISGIPLRSKRFAERDLFNKPKYGGVDLIAFELTAAASLLFGQTNEGVPVVIARGYEYEIMDEVIDQSKNFPYAKKILKEILKVSIKSRISAYFDKFFHPFRKG
jgi:coenzyme F420-0:L-glutamate ligase/coenzyme F420-1:gamma-L-glutamate ligase